MPSALVTDIATDPNGRVLQIATGRPSVIYVIVPVDGTLRLATGTVFDFYQFEQPLSDRMTDTEWRQRIGVWMSEEGTYNWKAVVEKPWWTASYRVWSRTAITRTDEKTQGLAARSGRACGRHGCGADAGLSEQNASAAVDPMGERAHLRRNSGGAG